MDKLFGNLMDSANVFLNDNLIPTVERILKTVIDKIPEFLPSLIEAIGGFIETIGEALPDLISDIVATLPDLLMGLIAMIVEYFADPPNKIWDAIKRLLSIFKIYLDGDALVGGIASSMDKKLGSIAKIKRRG